MHAALQIGYMAILETIDPAVYRELLSALPGALDDLGAAQVLYLSLDIELTHAIDLVVHRQGFKIRAITAVKFAHAVQPIIDHTALTAGHRGANTAAPVMTDDHDVLDLENINRELNH